MNGYTTVKVRTETAKILREMAPSMDEAIRKALGAGSTSETLVFPVEPEGKISPGIKAYEVDRVGYNGKIKEIIIHFPAETNHLVDVRILYLPRKGGSKAIVPTGNKRYITMANATPHFKPDIPVEANSEIRVEWINRSTKSLHVPVLITIEKRGK